jgi:hypothetical protein
MSIRVKKQLEDLDEFKFIFSSPIFVCFRTIIFALKKVYEYFEPRGVVGECYEVGSVQVLKDNK